MSRDYPQADAAIEKALQAAPTDAEVLASASLTDLRHEDRDAAVAKLERARELDPRSFFTVSRLAQPVCCTAPVRRCRGGVQHRLLLQPGDLGMIGGLAMARAGAGKLDEARAGIRAAIESGVPAPAIAAQLAGRQEVSWILEDKDRQLVFRLTPQAFDNDRAWWGQSLAAAYWQAGDPARARFYADSSLAESKRQAEASPRDAQLQVLYGLVLAYAGHAAEARAAVARAQAAPDDPAADIESYIIVNAVRIELALGNPSGALDILEKNMALAGMPSPAHARARPDVCVAAGQSEVREAGEGDVRT